jgi:hypothetical protein
MERFGWSLVLAGVAVAVASAVPLAYVMLTTSDPTINPVGHGIFFSLGSTVGLVLAAFGLAAVAKARGVKTPPV